ncbi:unnamed protein product [Amoebophrya sp. A25]|nr:unnamed protein product [Amoebophrya sp. A25]|eukprot:GSA25T00017796001.1
MLPVTNQELHKFLLKSPLLHPATGFVEKARKCFNEADNRWHFVFMDKISQVAIKVDQATRAGNSAGPAPIAQGFSMQHYMDQAAAQAAQGNDAGWLGGVLQDEESREEAEGQHGDAGAAAAADEDSD